MMVLFDVFKWLIIGHKWAFDRLSSFDLFLTTVYIKPTHLPVGR